MGSTRLSRAPLTTMGSEGFLIITDLLCQRNTETLLPIAWEDYEKSDEAYITEVHTLELTDDDAVRLHRELTLHLKNKGLL